MNNMSRSCQSLYQCFEELLHTGLPQIVDASQLAAGSRKLLDAAPPKQSRGLQGREDAPHLALRALAQGAQGLARGVLGSDRLGSCRIDRAVHGEILKFVQQLRLVFLCVLRERWRLQRLQDRVALQRTRFQVSFDSLGRCLDFSLAVFGQCVHGLIELCQRRIVSCLSTCKKLLLSFQTLFPESSCFVAHIDNRNAAATEIPDVQSSSTRHWGRDSCSSVVEYRISPQLSAQNLGCCNCF
mmetsp:Transcript_36107/g.84446  ORF Transcript_36107/g.84446 Transcript_36107/m.84446 type:complete len:241 (-) Transcript_36107:251-973(-)